MSTNPESTDGACGRYSGLESSYLIVGTALLAFEQKNNYLRISSDTAFTEFREDLVFVPVELLEAYLEDLLNIKIPDSELFISLTPRCWLRWSTEFGLVLVSVGLGCLASWYGASSSLAMFLVFCCGILPLVLWYYLSHFSARRRLQFAKVLSSEISRRRGRDEEGRTPGIASFKDLFIRPRSSGAQGAARIIFH